MILWEEESLNDRKKSLSFFMTLILKQQKRLI